MQRKHVATSIREYGMLLSCHRIAPRSNPTARMPPAIDAASRRQPPSAFDRVARSMRKAEATAPPVPTLTRNHIARNRSPIISRIQRCTAIAQRSTSQRPARLIRYVAATCAGPASAPAPAPVPIHPSNILMGQSARGFVRASTRTRHWAGRPTHSAIAIISLPGQLPRHVCSPCAQIHEP